MRCRAERYYEADRMLRGVYLEPRRGDRVTSCWADADLPVSGGLSLEEPEVLNAQRAYLSLELRDLFMRAL
jgi:hypothetical protein